MTIELKWDKSAEGAIGQIKDKGYVEALKEYKGNDKVILADYVPPAYIFNSKLQSTEKRIGRFL